jgi:hypothetical protein
MKNFLKAWRDKRMNKIFIIILVASKNVIARSLKWLLPRRNDEAISCFGIITGVLYLLICTCSLHADYFNPPCWQSSRDYTHQSWDFGNDENAAPTLPALPDGEPIYVTPADANAKLIAVDYNVIPAFQHLIPAGLVGWKYDYEMMPTNRKAFYGGMGDVVLAFKISNTANKSYYWKKRIWVQSVFCARNDSLQPYEIKVARNADFTDTNDIALISVELKKLNDANSPDGNLSRWYVLTAIYEIKDICEAEYVKITSYQYPPDSEHVMGGASIIDRVDIDTRYFNKADFDENGTVDFLDFVFFAEQWLK